MTIVADIKPEVQAALRRQAAARAQAEPKKLILRQLDATLWDLAQFSHKIPALPDEAFSRESLYRDRD